MDETERSLRREFAEDAVILRLRDEAAKAGDLARSVLCGWALNGNRAARAECLRLAEARRAVAERAKPEAAPNPGPTPAPTFPRPLTPREYEHYYDDGHKNGW